MELGEYMLSSVEEMLQDARSESARRVARREALQLVSQLNSKYSPEEQHQILQVLLRVDEGAGVYPPEVRTQADALLGWLEEMRSTVSGKPPASSACAALLPPRYRDAAAALCFSSAIAGGLGWIMDVQWLFWIGALLAAFNFLLNIASRILKAIIAPVALAFLGASILDPWYVGAAVGLILGNAVEAAGELIGRARTRVYRGVRR